MKKASPKFCVSQCSLCFCAAAFFLLTSCSLVKNIQKGGHLLQEGYSYYVNDSLLFSYRLGGNIDQINNKTKIRNTLAKANIKLPVRNCIACFKTWPSPNPGWIESTYYTLYFPNKKQTIHNKLLNIVKNESNDFYFDTNKYIIGKFIPLENDKGSVYIISHSGKDGFLSSIQHNDISNIVTNERYRDIDFTDPFELAGERDYYADCTVNYLTPVYLLKKHEQNYTGDSWWNWLQAYAAYVSRLSSELITFREYVQKLNSELTKEQLMCLDSIILTNSLNWDIYYVNNLNYEQFVTKNGYKNYTISIPKEIAKQAKKKPLTYIVSIYNADEYLIDKTAIPIYNHVLNNNSSKITIKLPVEKNYFYTIRHRYGKILFQKNIFLLLTYKQEKIP